MHASATPYIYIPVRTCTVCGTAMYVNEEGTDMYKGTYEYIQF